MPTAWSAVANPRLRDTGMTSGHAHEANSKRSDALVIEDELSVRTEVSAALGKLGLSVVAFDNAGEALTAVADCQPKIIFLDVALNQSDAVDVIKGLGSATTRVRCSFSAATRACSRRSSGLLCATGSRFNRPSQSLCIRMRLLRLLLPQASGSRQHRLPETTEGPRARKMAIFGPFPLTWRMAADTYATLFGRR